MYGAASTFVFSLVLLYSSLHICAQLLSTEVSSSHDEVTGDTIVTCTAAAFETIDWQITAESSDFELNIDYNMVQRSTSNDMEVVQGVTLNSAIMPSSISPQQKSGSLTLIITSSFTLEDNFLFSCNTFHFQSSNGGITSSTQRGSLRIFIGDTDASPPTEPNTNDNLIIIIVPVVVLILLVIVGTVTLCAFVYKYKTKRNNTTHNIATEEHTELHMTSQQTPPLSAQSSSSPIILPSEPVLSTTEPEYLSLTDFRTSELQNTATSNTMPVPAVVTTSSICYVQMTRNEAYGVLNGDSDAITSTSTSNVQTENDGEDEYEHYY